MAEKLCTLRTQGGGGGGRYTETSLWTNSAPTSDFAGQDVTLSESFDNYKYVKVRYKLSKTNNTEAALIVTSDDLKKSLGGDNQINMNFGGRTTTTRDRIVRYVNSTTLTITVAYHLNGTTTSTSDLIPLEILGLNELDHGTRESSLGTLTYQTSSNFKVTLGFKPKALQVFMRGNDSNTITLQYDENISTTKYVRNYTGSSAQSGWQTIGSTANQRRLWSIDDDGFTLTPNTDTSAPTIYYSAVGDV